jgi:hypothetical protein
LEVSHGARNFDQIEIGNRVRAEYFESVTIYFGKPGQKPDASDGLVAARSAKGEKPAALAVETVDVSARVQAIDRSKRLLTLQLPDGSITKTSVDPSLNAFDTLKEGDTIHARFAPRDERYRGSEGFRCPNHPEYFHSVYGMNTAALK